MTHRVGTASLRQDRRFIGGICATISRSGLTVDWAGRIDPALDLGNGNTIASYDAKIGQVQAGNNDHNTTKATPDGKLDTQEKLERELDQMSVKMLATVRIKYGEDSAEYEMAGGTRKSE